MLKNFKLLQKLLFYVNVNIHYLLIIYLNNTDIMAIRSIKCKRKWFWNNYCTSWKLNFIEFMIEINQILKIIFLNLFRKFDTFNGITSHLELLSNFNILVYEQLLKI